MDIASFTSQQTTTFQTSNLGVITNFLVLERAVYEQRALVQPLPAALQLVNRQKGADLLLDLAVNCAFPAHTIEFALRIS